MALSDSIGNLSPYAARLLDDYVYGQLEDAAADFRAAYQRLSGRPPARALEDRKLQRQVQSGAESLRNAIAALQGRKPKRRRRLVGPAVLVAVAAGAAAILSDESLLDRLLGREQ